MGAGFAGQTLARELRDKGVFGKVVAFLDDDSGKIGQRLEGIPVLGPIDAVVSLVEKTPADEAIIAIPSATRTRIQELYTLLSEAGFAKIRILPSVAQILEGQAHLIQTRTVDPQDLLGRDPVAIGLKESLAYLRGKRVLVTGAGGSIGSEISRQLLSAGVQRLYLFGHGENSIYEIDRELRMLRSGGVGEHTDIVPVVGDLIDRDYVFFLLKRLKADAIFHCAAYKHVPLMESNPVAVIANNVFGTKNLADAAKASQVKRLVLISTDKAVDPESIYGASKYLCERVVLDAAKDAEGKCMVVRFGNVLGSRGSIMPLFQRQISQGGPVTVTDPAATRFFMTIPEACSLVLKAGGLGKSGGQYLLDMGLPVNILSMAEQMIRFNGYEPGRDIPIQIIGLRDGERLHERLHNDREEVKPSPYGGILELNDREDWAQIGRILDDLRPICFLDPQKPDAYRNRRMLRQTLKLYFPDLHDKPQEGDY